MVLAAAAALPAGPAVAAPAAEARLVASTEPGWPQFRGPRRDGVSLERGLLSTWPAEGPKVIWSAKGAGRGFASPVIAGGRVFLAGDFDDKLFVVAYDLEGRPLWRAQNGSAWLNQYQGARASVAYRDGSVYHKNAHGRVACFDAATGKEAWAVDLLATYRGENITWGLAECVLVDDRAVYAAAGGREAFLVALDRRTGALLWKSEPLIDGESKEPDSGSYTSPILVEFAGRRLLIGSSLRNVFCADADTGVIQWTRRRPTSYSVLAVTPVLVGDAVFVTAPFGPPGALLRLLPPAGPAGRVGVEEVWTTPLDTAHGGVVLHEGKLFGSYYPRNAGWAALDASTGKVVYEEKEFVKGSVVVADQRLYVLSEDGWMRLLEPAADRFVVHGSFRLVSARDRDAWAHPAIVDGRMYLRYHDTLTCYDIRGGGAR